jgi:hypothetical protein
MKLLSTLAFAAAALFAATFATAAPAKADSFGVYVGSNGFGIQVSNYNRGYYGYPGTYYGGGYDRCRDPWYRRYHRYCYGYGGYGYGYTYSGYHPYYRHHYYPRPWRGHWGHHWRGDHGWRGHYGRGHHGGGHRGHRGGH